MAFTPGNKPFTLDGTNKVEAVGAPASGKQRMVKKVQIVNHDTVAHTFKLWFTTSGPAHQEIEKSTSVAAGDGYVFEDYVLDATTESLSVTSDAAHTTTAPAGLATYADVP